ncbi:VOC family protein [Dietzia sp.]|uniref:VOC family protein n=1 Tax=Dietzia sp. TaxID=1871616 RepID=UPI002FDB9414
MSTPIRSVHAVYAIDCDDAVALAHFYADLLGWSVKEKADNSQWVDLIPPEGEASALSLACQTIPGYRRPTWPEGSVPQQAHIDFHVEDLTASAELAVAAGATRAPVQPGVEYAEKNGTGVSFLVFTDPAGHPFCLCSAPTLDLG